MRGRIIKVLLVDNNPKTLEMVKETLLRHSPDWIIETSETMKFEDIPDLIVRNIKDGNGSGLRMDITSCVSFPQQTISILELIGGKVYD